MLFNTEEQFAVAGIGPALSITAHFHFIHCGAKCVHGVEDNVSVIYGAFQRVGGELVLRDRLFQIFCVLCSLAYKHAECFCKLGLIAYIQLGAEHLLAVCAFGQLAAEGGDCGENVLPQHIQHGERLYVQDLAVLVQLDFIAGVKLSLGVYLVAGKKLNVLGCR